VFKADLPVQTGQNEGYPHIHSPYEYYDTD